MFSSHIILRKQKFPEIDLAPSVERERCTVVVSDVICVRSRRGKSLMTDTPMALEVQDALESSWANPRSVEQRLPEREVYVMVDALKNFMPL